MQRGEIGRLARWLDVTPRTLNNWKRLCGEAERRPPGRPPHSAEAHARARALVRSMIEVQGWGAGEEPIWRALRARDVPLRLVREELRGLKAAHRRRRCEARGKARRSASVTARDAVWSIDGTHLGRTDQGQKVIGEAVRDVASSRTLGAMVGPPPTSKEVMSLLDRVAAERGAVPLVLATDNGGENRGEVEGWCRRHRVIRLRNVPHVPEHNPWIERGFGELKKETALGRGAHLDDLQGVAEEIRGALVRLDGGRLRASRGWKTAHDYDRSLPDPSSRVPHTRFYHAARCAIAEAVRDCRTVRKRRLAAREAILRTLECYNLIRRTRGHAKSTRLKSEVVS